MKTIHLIQGTPEWHAHRATHFNASDAPAMMGCGLRSRSDLLLELSTGIARDVSDYVKENVFAPGHRFEALARPLAEKIVGEELYPVTGTNGQYSASFDGLTFLEDFAFEHKRLNQQLTAVFDDMDTMNPTHRHTGPGGRLLPRVYQVQMEHQAMVSGAKRVLFMASDWDDNDQLIAERHVWYHANPELRAQIVAGWTQLAEDLKTYVPAQEEAPVPAGKTPDTLPALRIELTGAVTASNLGEFKNTALAAIRAVNRELKTDQDFADADASVKWCAEVESRLAAAKEHALSQTTSIDALFKAIDDISEEARKVRLELSKLVSSRKEQIRAQIVSAAIAKGAEHIGALNDRIGKALMPVVPADYAGAVKNKRTLSSLKDAVDTELARFKIASNEIADRITLSVRAIDEAGHNHLFPDLQALVLKQPDDLAAVIAQRKAREAEAAQTAAQVVGQAVAQAMTTGMSVVRVQAGSGGEVQASLIPATEIFDNGPRIKLGEINARIAPLSITADGLASLGFAHVATDKAAKLYRECDLPAICDALIKVIATAKYPAAIAA